MFWSFSDIWISVKNQNLKKTWENKDDLDLFLSDPNFMRNRIIIPMLFIMEFF